MRKAHTVSILPLLLLIKNSCGEGPSTKDYFFHECHSGSPDCFTCLDNRATISELAVCDSYFDCSDFSDELFCGNLSVITLVANESSSLGIQECKNRAESDEFYANRFYDVFNAHPKKCDDYSICYDKEKECNVTSKDYKSDDSIVIVGLILGFSGIFLNFAVIQDIAKKLKMKRNILSPEQTLTKSLFLSLSVSDVLVSTYVTVMCSAELIEEAKSYCKTPEWYSSKHCKIIGCLVIVGSEQSIFTMVLISISRAWGIFRPFSRLPVKVFLICLLLAWIFSIMLAIIPLVGTLEDEFVEAVLNYQTPAMRTVVFSEIECYSAIFQHLLKGTEEYAGPSGSWAKMRYLMRKYFNIQEIVKIGYYDQGGCIPDIVFTKKTNSKWFTLSFVTVNVLCLFIMAAAYVSIYFKRKSSTPMAQCCEDTSSETSRLRRKIFLILLTDFIVWVPICLFGYHNYIRGKAAGGQKKAITLVAKVISHIIVPINSLINPFLYSAVPDFLLMKIHLRLKNLNVINIPEISRSSMSRPAADTHTHQTDPENSVAKNSFEQITLNTMCSERM